MNQRVISLHIGRVIPMACAVGQTLLDHALDFKHIIEQEIITYTARESLCSFQAWLLLLSSSFSSSPILSGVSILRTRLETSTVIRAPYK